MVHKVNWAFVDKIVYINLDRRGDRDALLRAELAALQAPEEKIMRFSAIATDPGYIGCTQSHLAVLTLAQQSGWKNVLILEDDMSFLTHQEDIERVNHFFHELTGRRWDTAFLAANYFDGVVIKKPDSFYFTHQCTLLKMRGAWCACAYLVNGHYYQTIIDTVSAGLEMMRKTQEEKYTVDAAWQDIMRQHDWIGLYPCFGYQRENYSDIRKGSTNYKSVFFRNLAEIEK